MTFIKKGFKAQNVDYNDVVSILESLTRNNKIRNRISFKKNFFKTLLLFQAFNEKEFFYSQFKDSEISISSKIKADYFSINEIKTEDIVNQIVFNDESNSEFYLLNNGDVLFESLFFNEIKAEFPHLEIRDYSINSSNRTCGMQDKHYSKRVNEELFNEVSQEWSELIFATPEDKPLSMMFNLDEGIVAKEDVIQPDFTVEDVFSSYSMDEFSNEFKDAYFFYKFKNKNSLSTWDKIKLKNEMIKEDGFKEFVYDFFKHKLSDSFKTNVMTC